MIERKYGWIINIASIAGKTATFHDTAYSASKHSLLDLTRTLAAEVATDGITVNAICPGPIHTLMNEKWIAYDAKRLGNSIDEIESRIIPIGRRLEPEEIVPLAVLLARTDCNAMTG